MTLAGGESRAGTTLSTDTAAYALLSLRTARRALDSLLVLYSNTRPDKQGVPCPLDSLPAVDGGATFGARLDALIDSLSRASFYDQLTTADGVAYGGWNVGAGAPTDDGTSLDAHAAADPRAARGVPRDRRDASTAIARRPSSSASRPRFYDPSARIYRPTPGDTSATVTFTPRALRDPPGRAARHLRAHRRSPGQRVDGGAHRGPRRAARTSLSSTAGTTAIRTRSSSGRRSARTRGRAAMGSRWGSADCRWRSGSSPGSRAR